MPSIATGLNKRAKRELYSGNFDKAVDLFYRTHFAEPENRNYIMDLIYALNQKSEYITAIQYCYCLLGMGESNATLYFFLAEAYGGIGSASACAKMLQKSLTLEPEGECSKEARAFLKNLKENYTLDDFDVLSDDTEFGAMNTMADIPFLNIESANVANIANQAAENGDYQRAINIIENELLTGNYSVTLLGMGIVLGKQLEDRKYIERCIERFRLVQDYTVYELRALAYNLSIVEDNDVAYRVYKTLYASESGEKEIAFGFAVACEKKDQISHARKIAEGLALSSGSVGVSQYYLEHCGEKTHTYVYRFENDELDKIKKSIISGEKASAKETVENAEYMRYAPLKDVQNYILTADTSDPLCQIMLRRLSVDNLVPLIVRCEIAHLLVQNGIERVFINMGTSIALFNEALYSAVFKFLEGNRQ